MAIKPFIKSLDDELPKITKDDFVAVKDEDGNIINYVLDVEETDGWALDNVAGLKTVLSDVKTERATLRKHKGEVSSKLGDRKLDDLIADSAALKQLKADSPDTEAAFNKRLEEAVAEIKQNHATELDGKSTSLTSALAKIEVLMVDSELDAALDKYDFVDGGKGILRPHLKSRIKVVKDGDDIVVRVMSKDGKTEALTMKKDSTSHMGIEELVETFSKNTKEYGMCFKGSGTGGSRGAESRANREDGTNAPVHKVEDGATPQTGFQRLAAARAAQETK